MRIGQIGQKLKVAPLTNFYPKINQNDKDQDFQQKMRFLAVLTKKPLKMDQNVTYYNWASTHEETRCHVNSMEPTINHFFIKRCLT